MDEVKKQKYSGIFNQIQKKQAKPFSRPAALLVAFLVFAFSLNPLAFGTNAYAQDNEIPPPPANTPPPLTVNHATAPRLESSPSSYTPPPPLPASAPRLVLTPQLLNEAPGGMQFGMKTNAPQIGITREDGLVLQRMEVHHRGGQQTVVGIFGTTMTAN